MDDVDIELDEMELVAAAAGYYYYNCISKQPSRGVQSKGSGFMSELLNGPEDVCRDMLRMDKHVFQKLCDVLRQRGLLRDTSGSLAREFLQPPPLNTPPEILKSNRLYPYFKTQRDIVIAACVIHNFIRREERNDWLFNGVEGKIVEELPDEDDQLDPLLSLPNQEPMGYDSRDIIAAEMWNDFINVWDQW
nr:hypothetical protein MIMGU_mgv1a011395mg [Ipomoea batatas]